MFNLKCNPGNSLKTKNNIFSISTLVCNGNLILWVKTQKANGIQSEMSPVKSVKMSLLGLDVWCRERKKKTETLKESKIISKEINELVKRYKRKTATEKMKRQREKKD
jgi:hypothetical protein